MRPLGDVRIIAVEQYGAGPFGSVHLAELGAEVIKVEDPNAGGDVGRTVVPFAEDGDSLFFETFNHDKRAIDLDLSTPAGREVFEDLVRHADAVYSNLRGDVPEKIRIRYDDLAHVNPRIVCCSLTGFGMTGPRRNEPGYDYMLQGMAGWMSLTGEPGGPPTKTGPSLVDYATGYVAALALVTGIHAARRDGRGMDCDVSLFDTALNLLGYVATWQLTAGYEAGRRPRSAHPSLVPFQNLPTKDGWIVVACPKEKFWQRLCEAIGRPELAGDARFADFSARREHFDAVNDELDAVLRTKTTDEWIAVLQPTGVPCAPIRDVAQAFADPHAAARGMVVETEHPRFGTVRQAATPVKVGEMPDPATGHRRAPRRNEDADHVLGTILGYDAPRRAALAAAGAFGPLAAPLHP